jgi:hypothetical protein
MNDSTNAVGMTLGQVARFLSVCTLAIATICVTLPAPQALAAPSQVLVAQAYPPPPPDQGGYPPPAGYGQPPPPGYGPPMGMPPPGMNDGAQGALDGRTDAPQQISGTLWFFVGFLLSWIGIILGYVLSPSPDGARLVGKSPAYVSSYTVAYQEAGRSYQGIHAVWGCVTSGAIYLVIVLFYYIFAVALVASTA